MYKIFRPWIRLGTALVLLASAAVPFTAKADGMSASFSISGVDAREMGLEVWSNTAVSSASPCPNTTTFRILSSYSNYQMISSLLMTAFVSGKNVHLWVTGCDTDGASLFIAAWVDK